MHRITRVLAGAAIGAALLTPGTVAAHEGVGGRIFALGDHVTPGEPFEIIGIEIDADATLSIELANGSAVADLGRVTVASDGTFSTSAIVPASFPNGYAMLTATSDEPEIHVETFVLVGEQPGASPVVGTADGQALDVLSIGLVLLAIGVVVFAFGAFRYVRR